MRGFTVETPGATLAGTCEKAGNRTPLVLIHGFGGSGRDWDKGIAADYPDASECWFSRSHVRSPWR